MKKIAIYSRKINENNINTVIELFKKLDKFNCILVIFDDLYQQIKEAFQFKSKCQIFKSHEDVAMCNFLISIGGDGTLLDTITYIRDSGTPVIGFNIGKLGFLANATLADIDQTLNHILNNNYAIEERSLLKIESNALQFNEINYALNDITLHKSDASSMIKIDAFIDELFLNSYWADGIIISTPTGSTAYSLSCGGPIIAPNSNNFIITPIASHNLTVRPIVISDQSRIKLQVNALNKPFIISLDSRKFKLSKKSEFLLMKEKFSFNIIKTPDCDFYSTIRKKLLWGHDIRN
ncbi:MAG: NAD kinase [Bacteroidales bacterium]|nr:NAD kinase [Bacteroidales bacterium]